ncbi:MAG TPA: AAA family ATPase, partial [Thermoanaerobaculia bacterium]|nr:AAA family ATPase [Thermoanaerobaculia bacterium]
MLRRLAIKNLAIVEDLELELGSGLTVLTGETGAGKSILVDALLLLGGGRGSSDLVRQGSDRLVVAGEFEVDEPVRRLLTESGLPASDRILVKRELSPEGRGRAFVEDEPAAVRTLSRLGDRLLTIHGQNSEQELIDRSAALELLDAFAKAEAEVTAVAAAAASWTQAREELESLEASRRDRAHRLEVLAFEIREIEEVSPTESEEEELLSDRARLSHADRVRRAGETALMALSEGEDSAGDRIGQALRAFGELASIDPRESIRVSEAEDLKRRVADLAAAARDAAEGIEADPDRLTAIETRLEKIARIKRKYGPSVADVLSRLAAAKKERSDLANIEDA